MRFTVFSAHHDDRAFLEAAAREHGHVPLFLSTRLDPGTAMLAANTSAICVFITDRLDSATLTALAATGVRAITLRCTGYDHVDLQSAATLGLRIARVPGYSPHAVAEHAIGLMLVLLRRLHRAYNRVREGNFSLEELLGSNLAGKTVAVLGTGSIGSVMAHILLGFGCTVLAYDAYPDAKLSAIGVRYVPLGEALAFADIITLHLPLTPATRHLIDDAAIAGMRSGAMIINTGRGGLLDTAAAINGLKSGRIGALGIDVYEHEGEIFFADHSDSALADDLFARLLTFPNVVVTGHQAFFTREALGDIATATMANLTAFERGIPSLNDLAL